MTNIIEVKNFTKMYGGFMAVDDISFNVKEGSIFSFLGPNGAGKTTTINTLCTIIEKTKGEIKINGYDTSNEKNEVRSSIGIVFQDQTLDEKMTVEENLKMHCVFYDVPREEIRERIDFALGIVDLKKWAKKPVRNLSGGMKRRVEISRALLHYPKVLFLDEPTTGLDPQTRNNMWEYILKLQKEKNITIFLTTHYMDEAEISDKVGIIDGGKIIVMDTPENLKETYTKDKAFIRVNNSEKFKAFLNLNTYKFTRKNSLYEIELRNLDHLYFLTENAKKLITELEVKKGTLNDVFLEVTGKEIREEVK